MCSSDLVAASGLSYLEMDLDEASLNVHISDYLIQNLHPRRYISHLQVPILKPPDLQHRRIWKEARGKLTHLACPTHPTHLTHLTTTCLLKRRCCKQLGGVRFESQCQLGLGIHGRIAILLGWTIWRCRRSPDHGPLLGWLFGTHNASSFEPKGRSTI